VEVGDDGSNNNNVKDGGLWRSPTRRRPAGFIEVATTSAWSWQQGAMLQWHPSEPENTIVYNDFRGGKFVCVVRVINEPRPLGSGQQKITHHEETASLRARLVEEKILPRAVGAVSPDGKWAGCLNFARLHDERPGYGYCNAVDP